MEFPAGLPSIIEYAVGCTVRYALPRTKVSYVSSNGQTNAPFVCPTIPYGATGWRLSHQSEWRPLSELPEPWLPFLNRQRPSDMDCRPL